MPCKGYLRTEKHNNVEYELEDESLNDLLLDFVILAVTHGEHDDCVDNHRCTVESVRCVHLPWQNKLRLISMICNKSGAQR